MITSETISTLRRLLNEKKLSVIVGAGFSKNASPKFLSWKELLKDMIMEMYGFMVKQSVEYDKVRGGRKEQIFWKEFVNQIILEKGYLSIASEYTKRHGFREAIDEYIEVRTPLVVKEKDTYNAKIRKQKYSEFDSVEVDLTVHKLLLEINWNNVYTFNYDNLLEIAGETDRHEELENKKKELSKELSFVEEEREKVIKEIERLKNIKEQIESTEKYIVEINEDTIVPKKDKKPEAKDLEEIKEIGKLETKYKELTIRKEIIPYEECSIEKEQVNLLHLVDESSKLSLQKDRNIIKLHGTIRKHGNKEYGFDNDLHCQYIITTEDYERFQHKHDAFVALMRIALLQDSFCLIGFSGDDPNFMSWLSWVRDILDRRGLEDKVDKIFFIDVSGHQLSESKKLFFKNHFIKHIPLFDNPLEITPQSIKEKLIQLLQELNCKDKAGNAILQYSNFWQNFKLDKSKEDESYLYGHKRSDIRELWDNLKYNRLSKLELDFIGRKEIILSNLNQTISNGKIDEDTAKLFTLALKGDFLPLHAFIDDDKYDVFFNLVKLYPKVCWELELVHVRDLNLTGKDISMYTANSTSDAIIYESILNSAFCLDFTLMKQQLDSWSPEDIRWKSGKLAFQSLFNLYENYNNIEYIEKTHDSNNQEYLYYLETILKVTIGFKWFNKTDEYYLNIKKKIDAEDKKLYSLGNNIEYLVKKLSEEKIDVSPHDNTSRTLYMGGDMSLKYSIQSLQVIIENGLPLHNNFVQFLKKEDWYHIFKNIYTLYPFPCLFYSLQYGGDEKFIKRIAEDYVYSNELSSIHSDILLRVLKAHLMSETPDNIKKGILSFSQLFFRIVPYKLWRHDFEKIVSKFDFSNRNLNRKIANPFYDFLYAGLANTNSNSYKIRAISNILSLDNQIDHIDNSILIAAKTNLKKRQLTNKVSGLIDKLIEDAEQSSQYYVLFNLHDIFSTFQEKKLISRLLKYDFQSCNDNDMFEATSRYAKSVPALSQKIENEIKESKLLWDTGISFDENNKRIIGIGGEFVKINNILDHINFSKQSILEIYYKMKESLVKLKDVLQNRNDDYLKLTNWERLMLEMHLFLRNNKTVLKSEKDYEQVTKDVEQSYHKLYKAESIMDAIISNDSSKVRSGIQNLVFDVENFGIQKFTSEYLVIVNRIVSKANPGLNSCIIHFTSVMQQHHEEIDKKVFKPFVSKILEQYAPYYSDSNADWNIDAKKEDVENSMIILNEVAKKWHVGNQYWNKHKRIFKTIE